jgi:hypothetical protein
VQLAVHACLFVVHESSYACLRHMHMYVMYVWHRARSLLHARTLRYLVSLSFLSECLAAATCGGGARVCVYET